MHRVSVDWSITTADFEPSLKRFRRYLEDLGIRDTTISNYIGNVLRYLRFAETANPSTNDLERFRDFLAGKKVSRSTKNQYNYSIKAYHAMLGETIEMRRLEPNNQIPYYFDKRRYNEDIFFRFQHQALGHASNCLFRSSSRIRTM